MTTTQPEVMDGKPAKPPELPPPTNVVEALARVMSDLPGIGKTEHSEQGYAYRGIESITRHAQTLFGKYGVVFVPRVIGRKTTEFLINGRPWTQEELEVVYTIYGPGGVDDKIEVGPILGLGRDNSDKGANKCMTQAYKYALIQTLCIGDQRDDPDQDPAHEADRPEQPVDLAKEARLHLATRIREQAPAVREALRLFCDEHGIPRVTAKMSDEQVESVAEWLDERALDDAAAAEAAALAPDSPPLPFNGAPGRDAPSEVPVTPQSDPEPIDATRLLDDVIAEVKAMPIGKVNALLAKGEHDTIGMPDERRDRLAKVIYEERLGRSS